LAILSRQWNYRNGLFFSLIKIKT